MRLPRQDRHGAHRRECRGRHPAPVALPVHALPLVVLTHRYPSAARRPDRSAAASDEEEPCGRDDQGARPGSGRDAGPSCPARTAAVSGPSRIAPLVPVLPLAFPGRTGARRSGPASSSPRTATRGTTPIRGFSAISVARAPRVTARQKSPLACTGRTGGGSRTGWSTRPAPTGKRAGPRTGTRRRPVGRSAARRRPGRAPRRPHRAPAYRSCPHRRRSAGSTAYRSRHRRARARPVRATPCPHHRGTTLMTCHHLAPPQP
ncbi:hypothetical protein P376_1993 [Streptomyces sp. HCCB10043]|nr:hypothetical protein P376_1993 [Streptomyces sp. HCCB10043]